MHPRMLRVIRFCIRPNPSLKGDELPRRGTANLKKINYTERLAMALRRTSVSFQAQCLAPFALCFYQPLPVI